MNLKISLKAERPGIIYLEGNGSNPDIFTIPNYREKFFDMLEE